MQRRVHRVENDTLCSDHQADLYDQVVKGDWLSFQPISEESSRPILVVSLGLASLWQCP